jgi:alanyl-tRNA synthetase/misacylated tRNA(Ala) deacylase
MPKLLYHKDPYLREVTTEVETSFEDDGKVFVVLRDCLFHPQGGGQKGDRGTLERDGLVVKVLDTVTPPLPSHRSPALVLDRKHPGLTAGKPVKAVLDWDHRYKQMRLHDTVHMHHCMMEKLLGRRIPFPATSNLLDDGSAYNRYETKDVTEELAAKAAAELHAAIAKGAPITMRDDPEKPGFRWWSCLGYSIPCGGTHLRDIGEIGAVKVEFSQRKGKPKVLFTLA